MPDGRPSSPGDSGGRLALGATLLLVLCCAGHDLLLALGFAGVGAAVGAITGSTAALAEATVVLALIAVLAVVRARRRSTAPPSDATTARAPEGDPL